MYFIIKNKRKLFILFIYILSSHYILAEPLSLSVKDSLYINDTNSIQQIVRLKNDLGDSSKNVNKNEASNLMFQLAKAYLQNKKYDDAIEYLLQSLSIEKELNHNSKIADIYRIMAKVYKQSGNSKKALEYYKNALSLNKILNRKKEISTVLNQIGLIYSDWENYEKALNFFNEALNIKESNDDKLGIANCYNNMAYIYYRWRNFDYALEYNKKSLKIYKELKQETKISYVLNNIGLIYIATKNYDLALQYINKSMAIEKKLNNSAGMAESFNNIGLIYHKQGKLNEAFVYYNKYLQITKESGNKEQLAIAYSNIGTIYLHNNNINKAIEYLNKSTEIAKEGNYKRTLVYNYKSYSNAYSILKDYEKSLEYFKIYVTEKDSIFNTEKHKQIHELKIQYETEKKEHEINLLNTEKRLDKIKLKTQRKELTILGIGFFLILFLLIITLINNSKRKKAYEHLVSKNMEIAKSEKKLQTVKQESQHIADEERTYLKTIHKNVNQSLHSINESVEFYAKNNKNHKIKEIIKSDCIKISSELNKLLITDSTQPEDIQSNKYSGSPISEEQKQEILDGIIDLMENKKLFLDNDINLEKIANKLKTNKKYISQIINEQYGQNISNFINEYRIKEARQLLSDSNYKNLTIEGIAESVGFNSKSAFNISFKKITGITPSFYQKSIFNNT